MNASLVRANKEYVEIRILQEKENASLTLELKRLLKSATVRGD
jgi:hypothetical protein